ncbi:hypothetical protein LDENG_00238140 [Lucifuga dentata]|nr:hypothetical protein LDENG_00238140 [Lucifuga dentata]
MSPFSVVVILYYTVFCSNIFHTINFFQVGRCCLKDHTTHFCMFEPNIFNFHTCNVTDNHFPKDKTVFQLS